MSKNITVTFDDGTKQPYKNIPDTVSKEEFVARVKKDFPTKKIKQVDVEGPTATPPVGQSAQQVQPNNSNIANTSTPPDATAAAQPDDDKDYRADFPNLFTPKNMKRNKAGHLIFQ